MNVRRVIPLKDEVFFCNFICKRYRIKTEIVVVKLCYNLVQLLSTAYQKA